MVVLISAIIPHWSVVVFIVSECQPWHGPPYFKKNPDFDIYCRALENVKLESQSTNIRLMSGLKRHAHRKRESNMDVQWTYTALRTLKLTVYNTCTMKMKRNIEYDIYKNIRGIIKKFEDCLYKIKTL